MADDEKTALVENSAGDNDAEAVDMEEAEAGDQTEANAKKAAALSGALMQNPAVLAAIQDRLGGMVGLSGGYIESLPKCVKRRIKALKKLQFESLKVEAKFYEEVHLLECKYSTKYQPILDKRKTIVNGSLEPTDSDCDWPSDEEEDAELAGEAKAKLAIENESSADAEGKTEKAAVEEKDENTKGIPYFWLTVFKNVEMLADMVQDHDEPIVKHLEDVRVSYSDREPYGFTLHFVFSENEYFTNTELTKEYELRVEPEETDPFGYEGVEIVKCKGCTIDWNKGKNVTVKTVKKTQRHKGRGTKRTITKQVQNDSFFNFFAPPAEAENEDDDDTEALLAADFEIGQFIREQVVPKAVLYFTGEALEDDEYDDDEEEGEEGEEEEGSDEEADPDFNPANAKNPQECKQQ